MSECIESGEMVGECRANVSSPGKMVGKCRANVGPMLGKCIESGQSRVANVGASKIGRFMHK